MMQIFFYFSLVCIASALFFFIRFKSYKQQSHSRQKHFKKSYDKGGQNMTVWGFFTFFAFPGRFCKIYF